MEVAITFDICTYCVLLCTTELFKPLLFSNLCILFSTFASFWKKKIGECPMLLMGMMEASLCGHLTAALLTMPAAYQFP